VLPLRRSRLLFSALLVGSLAPDFPYFFLMTARPAIGHSVEGLFRFCLPTGLAVLWLFHAIVKRPLADLAPAFIRSRISEADLEFHFWPLSRLLRILGSLLVGSITHILWDGFTHDHGYFVKAWPLLRERVLAVPRQPPIFKLLQFGCSGLGVAIVIWVAWRVWRNKSLSPNPVGAKLGPVWRGVAAAMIVFAGAAVGVAEGIERSYHHLGWRACVIDGVIFSITAFCAAVVAYSLVWHAFGVSGKQKPLDHEAQGLEVPAQR